MKPPRPWAENVPALVWGPLTSALLMLAAALLALATGRPLLFPSLGPTAFLHSHDPKQPAASLYNTLVGHALGLAAGYLSVFVFAAASTPALFAAHSLAPERGWASVLAIALTLLLQQLTKSYHPPAAATTLLVALGGFRPTLGDAGSVVIGVLVVALLGEVVRRGKVTE
ncbi:MAG TPA: HPP family protein [Deinococcales bacterium]|nr:HPP family protein [Deinococcales bacterium]